MSKTKRTVTYFQSNKNGHWGNGDMVTEQVDDTRAKWKTMNKAGNRRMRPYTTKKHPWKFTDEHGGQFCGNTSQQAKLVNRNANRSYKKSARQDAKKEIRETLDGLY